VPATTVLSDGLTLVPFVGAEAGVVGVSSSAFAVAVLVGVTVVTSTLEKV
jgi:hypothetical protein